MSFARDNGRSIRWTILMMAALLLSPGAAFGQLCDDGMRQAFQHAVDEGVMSEEEIEASFGDCRLDPDQDPSCEDPAQTGGFNKVISFPLTGNVRFETMRRCGYHPKNEEVSCEVELRRRTGYGASPTGSDEYVLFCLDCDRDGRYDFRALGSVHVNNDTNPAGPSSPTNPNGSDPRWYFSVSASTQAARNACTADDGGQTDVRAILSWNRVPRRCRPARPPIFGRIIDFTARRDP